MRGRAPPPCGRAPRWYNLVCGRPAARAARARPSPCNAARLTGPGNVGKRRQIGRMGGAHRPAARQPSARPAPPAAAPSMSTPTRRPSAAGGRMVVGGARRGARGEGIRTRPRDAGWGGIEDGAPTTSSTPVHSASSMMLLRPASTLTVPPAVGGRRHAAGRPPDGSEAVSDRSAGRSRRHCRAGCRRRSRGPE